MNRRVLWEVATTWNTMILLGYFHALWERFVFASQWIPTSGKHKTRFQTEIIEEFGPSGKPFSGHFRSIEAGDGALRRSIYLLSLGYWRSLWEVDSCPFSALENASKAL